MSAMDGKHSMSAMDGKHSMSAMDGNHVKQTVAEPAWQNPWFMAAFFCIAIAVGLLWQSAQIDADAQLMIEQLRATAPRT